jgi:hypothetical protein
MGCMADSYVLAGLTLPQGVAHESLPATVTRFMSDCWHGMSRSQMIARAKRRGCACRSAQRRHVRPAKPACSNCASTMGQWNA